MHRTPDVARRTAYVGSFAVLSALAVIEPLPVAGVVVTSGLLFLLLRRPYTALVSFFALVPFHFLGFELATGRFHTHVGPLVYWKEVLLVGLLIQGVRQRARKAGDLILPASSADRFLIAYVLVLLLWAAMSPFSHPAIDSFVRTAEGPVMILTILALAPPRAVVFRCLIALLAGAAVMGSAALIEQFFPHSFQMWYGFKPTSEVFYSQILAGKGYRSGSFFGDSLVLGFFLSGAASLALASLFLTQRRARALAAFALSACIIGTVTTFTRSALVAVPLGLVITLSLTVQRPATRVATIGLTVTSVLLVGGLFVASGTQRFSHSGDTSVHLQLLRSAFAQSMRHPLGFGLGTTDYVAHRFNIQGYVGQSVDSVYGDRLVEGGIVILVAYLLALFSTVLRLVRARRRSIALADPAARALTSGALGAFIAVAAAGLFLPVQEQPVTLTAWGAAGLALAAVGQSGAGSAGPTTGGELTHQLKVDHHA